jgi:hypothetical protein
MRDAIAVPCEETYTLILTKGVHTISSETAELIAAAVKDNLAIVEVKLDPFGGVDPERCTLVAVRHVVAIAKNPPLVLGTGNVAPIRGRKRSAPLNEV